MSRSILFPPHNKENDFSILFIKTSGCFPMSGHGIIGTSIQGLEKNYGYNTIIIDYGDNPYAHGFQFFKI